MTKNKQPGMVASAISGFNRVWTAVQSVKNSKGVTLGWTFTCGGCSDRAFFKVRATGDAHASAVALIDKHRCPPNRQQAAQRMREIAKVA